MHFQEKSCYDSCHVQKAIAQTHLLCYHWSCKNPRICVLHDTTFHSKQLLHFHLRKQRVFNEEERPNEQGTNLAFNFPSRYILPV